MVAFSMALPFFFKVLLAVNWRNFTLTTSILLCMDSSTTIKYYTVNIHVYKKSLKADVVLCNYVFMKKGKYCSRSGIGT